MLTETITWRPVAEGLPDADMCVLIACDTQLHSEPVWIGFHDGECWREAGSEPAFVTHWAQLPGAPAGAPQDLQRKENAGGV